MGFSGDSSVSFGAVDDIEFEGDRRCSYDRDRMILHSYVFVNRRHSHVYWEVYIICALEFPNEHSRVCSIHS